LSTGGGAGILDWWVLFLALGREGFALLSSGSLAHGQDAKAGAWPWQVSVQINGFHICGGSLISESWVVSAAHCFIFGQSRLHSFALVKRIILHPSYNSVTHQADIALVELRNPVAFTATISPVSLLDASVPVPAGDTCWVTGWGNTSPQSEPGLHYSVKPILTVLNRFNAAPVHTTLLFKSMSVLLQNERSNTKIDITYIRLGLSCGANRRYCLYYLYSIYPQCTAPNRNASLRP
uniref:Peptidase S1 domain-containing protein n=1 Tax=Chelonoidis abingdonii TaxID=106734 RepID=A0A8C0JBX4_CHEAB